MKTAVYCLLQYFAHSIYAGIVLLLPFLLSNIHGATLNVLQLKKVYKKQNFERF